MSDGHFVKMIQELIHRVGIDKLSKELGISKPTFKYWSEARFLPLQVTRQIIYDKYYA